jgi:hypothetical protein
MNSELGSEYNFFLIASARPAYFKGANGVSGIEAVRD